MVFQQRAKSSAVRPFPVVMADLYRTEGFSGWYRGIAASLARESIYSSLRFGLYEPFRDVFESVIDKESNLQRIISRMAAGCSAGGLAAVVACPTELLKVRAQGYVGKPPRFHTLIMEVGGRPFKVRNFYEGVSTTVVRWKLRQKTLSEAKSKGRSEASREIKRNYIFWREASLRVLGSKQMSEAKPKARSEASCQIKSNFIFLTRSVASRFLLRFAQLFFCQAVYLFKIKNKERWASELRKWQSTMK